MMMFTNLLNTFTVKNQNIFKKQKLQIPSCLENMSKLVVDHLSQVLFLLSDMKRHGFLWCFPM